MAENEHGMWTGWKARRLIALLVISAASGITVWPARAQQASQDIEMLEVQPNFYMIAGAGSNIGVQVGPAGILLVDTGSSAMSDQVLAALKKLSPKPIRYIFDTCADPEHAGANAALSKA